MRASMQERNRFAVYYRRFVEKLRVLAHFSYEVNYYLYVADMVSTDILR